MPDESGSGKTLLLSAVDFLAGVWGPTAAGVVFRCFLRLGIWYELSKNWLIDDGCT